jgi:hypothetical protein
MNFESFVEILIYFGLLLPFFLFIFHFFFQEQRRLLSSCLSGESLRVKKAPHMDQKLQSEPHFSVIGIFTWRPALSKIHIAQFLC